MSKFKQFFVSSYNIVKNALIKIRSKFPQDWKTTSIGYCLFSIGVFLAVVHIWAPPEYKQTIAEIQGKLTATCVILSAYGFKVAADGKSVPPSK